MSCSNESETENMIDLRYELAMGRISGIAGENIVEPAFVDYFETPLDGSSRGSELITKD